MEKFCTKCGHKFIATGREVICPSCKQAAAEESKRAAVMRTKRASWTGESVPVRISGRASTVIRRYGAANGMPFAEALDELLKASAFLRAVVTAWQDVEPYKSRRRCKSDGAQEAPQEVKTQGKPQEVKTQEVKTAKAASKAAKTSTAKK